MHISFSLKTDFWKIKKVELYGIEKIVRESERPSMYWFILHMVAMTRTRWASDSIWVSHLGAGANHWDNSCCFSREMRGKWGLVLCPYGMPTFQAMINHLYHNPGPTCGYFYLGSIMFGKLFDHKYKLQFTKTFPCFGYLCGHSLWW